MAHKYDPPNLRARKKAQGTEADGDRRTSITVKEGVAEGLYTLDETGIVTSMVYITREMCGAEVESRGHLCPCVRVKGREWTLVEDANDDGALIEHKMCAICTRASKKQQKMDLKHGNGETYDYVFTLPAVYYRTLDMRDGEDARWVVAERMSEEEIRAFIERFNPGEQWERIVPHDLRQAVECTISQDEFGEGLSEVVDELFDLEPYSTERALRSSTTPKSIRESIALVGVGDHILENLIIASEKGEDGTEELEAAMAHIDIASPTLGDTVRTYGVSGGAGVSMRAQRILTITRSALEVAGSVVVANNVITGAEMDENGNDMSPAEESMKPSAGKDNAADDAALLLQAGLGDQDRHPETRSVPTPRKNLSKDFQTSGSGARGGEGALGIPAHPPHPFLKWLSLARSESHQTALGRGDTKAAVASQRSPAQGSAVQSLFQG